MKSISSACNKRDNLPEVTSKRKICKDTHKKNPFFAFMMNGLTRDLARCSVGLRTASRSRDHVTINSDEAQNFDKTDRNQILIDKELFQCTPVVPGQVFVQDCAAKEEFRT